MPCAKWELKDLNCHRGQCGRHMQFLYLQKYLNECKNGNAITAGRKFTNVYMYLQIFAHPWPCCERQTPLSSGYVITACIFHFSVCIFACSKQTGFSLPSSELVSAVSAFSSVDISVSWTSYSNLPTSAECTEWWDGVESSISRNRFKKQAQEAVRILFACTR